MATNPARPIGVNGKPLSPRIASDRHRRVWICSAAETILLLEVAQAVEME